MKKLSTKPTTFEKNYELYCTTHIFKEGGRIYKSMFLKIVLNSAASRNSFLEVTRSRIAFKDRGIYRDIWKNQLALIAFIEVARF